MIINAELNTGTVVNARDLTPLDAGIAMAQLTDHQSYSVDYIRVEPGSKEVTIEHHKTDEFLFLLSGKLEGTIGGTKVTLSQGSYVEIPRGTPHGFVNHGPDTCQLVSFCSPRYSSKDVFVVDE